MNNLEIKKYKNYKELCTELGWKVKTGKSKQVQMKDLDRVCKWHKEGNCIIIDEIFEKIKDKTDKRHNNGGNNTRSNKENDKRHNNGGNSTTYMPEIDELLENYIGNNKQVIDNFGRIIKTIGMVNDNFIAFSSIGSQKSISRSMQIPIETIKDFRGWVDGRIKSILENSLNRLERNKKISWNKGKQLVIKKDNKWIFRLATEDENNNILAYEKQILNEMGFNTIKEVFCYYKLKDFYKNVHKLCKQNDLCDFYYNVYIIDRIKDLDVKPIKNQKNKINIKIQKSIFKSAEKARDKVNKKGKLAGKLKDRNRQYENYLDDIKRLVEMFIDINSKEVLAVSNNKSYISRYHIEKIDINAEKELWCELYRNGIVPKSEENDDVYYFLGGETFDFSWDELI